MVNRPGNWGSQSTCFLVVRDRARPLGTFVGLKKPEDRIAVIAGVIWLAVLFAAAQLALGKSGSERGEDAAVIVDAAAATAE